MKDPPSLQSEGLYAAGKAEIRQDDVVRLQARTFIKQGSVTTAFISTVSTRGSRKAMSLMHE